LLNPACFSSASRRLQYQERWLFDSCGRGGTRLWLLPPCTRWLLVGDWHWVQNV